MTDKTPAGPAPKRTPAAKTPAAAQTPPAKTPVATAPATPRVTTAKTPAAKTTPAKTPVAKTTPAKTPAAKTAPAKAPAARRAPAAPAPASVAAVEPAPATRDAPAAAMAPAGWYPVAAGSPQQRWWDGARWTDHVYSGTSVVTPAVAPASVSPPLRAPEGVKAGTVWFWLLAAGAPVLTLLDLIPTSLYLSQLIGGDTSSPATFAANEFSPAYLLVALSGWFIYAVCIVFGLLDWRELKARGVPKPFHWAWSFFVIAVGWPAVYVIGRSVVIKRRTGGGLAPLWVFIGLQVLTFIATLVVVITAVVEFISVFSNALSTAGNVL